MSDLDLTRYDGHTPGPWRPDPYYPIYVWSGEAMVADLPSEGDEETYLARMRGVGRGATSAEQQANARLIADAPLLLAEVRRLREEVEQARKEASFVAYYERRKDEEVERNNTLAAELIALRQSHARLLEAVTGAYDLARTGQACWCGVVPHSGYCTELRAAVAEAEAICGE